ncbi:MAG: 50S ribosomal protein L13 [Bacteroidia bacterium]|nr:50S ribosomal protein L13 [Bacteroidia bacterium]
MYSFKTISANKNTVTKKWVIVDAEGQILGRLASRIAIILRGKHKASYTPHVDCGDNVIVINAEKIRVTGRKADQKEYVRHTGYPGGQRSVTYRNMMAKAPERILMEAVKGMLPKNRLGKRIATNVRIYAGTEHPHAAQNPEVLEF